MRKNFTSPNNSSSTEDVQRSDRNETTSHVWNPLWEQDSSLQDQNFEEHLDTHGDGDPQACTIGQTPGGLRQSQDVGNRVAETRAGEDAEVDEGGGERRSRQGVKQADKNKREDVLQVVLMAPSGHKQDTFNHQ